MFVSAAYAAADHAAKGGGLPQFESSTFSSQSFWAIVSFGILLFLLVKHVVPAIGDLLDLRAKRIEDEIKAAQEAKAEAEEARANHKRELAEARESVAKQMEQAQQEANEARKRAGDELAEELAKLRANATKEIEQAKAQAMEEIRNVAVDVAMLATEKLITKVVSKTDANKMVDLAMTKLKESENQYH